MKNAIKSIWHNFLYDVFRLVPAQQFHKAQMAVRIAEMQSETIKRAITGKIIKNVDKLDLEQVFADTIFIWNANVNIGELHQAKGNEPVLHMISGTNNVSINVIHGNTNLIKVAD